MTDMTDAISLVSNTAIAAGIILLAIAALHDIAARTVPNRLAGAIALAGMIAQSAQSLLGNSSILMALLAALIVFVVAAFMWRRGWMGGGDVKLLGAAALLVAPVLVPSLLMATSLAGGVLALFYLIARRRLPRPGTGRPAGLLARAIRAERWRLRRGGPLPYAVAIASGVFFVLSHGGLS